MLAPTKPTRSPKKPKASTDEVATLALPHPGAEFAELWVEFRTMPKQVKKPVTSLRRLLVTLGKYAEGFAQLMLEKAIEGNWSGVEYESTPKAYAEWRAAEAERARRQPVRTNSPDGEGPELNHEFLKEVADRKQQEEDAHFARYQVQPEPPASFNPDALFGYNQTAAEGIAQAQATPEYQQYLAEQAAAKPEPPAPPTQNPPDSAQQAA